jgi:hypothetical protein
MIIKIGIVFYEIRPLHFSKEKEIFYGRNRKIKSITFR